MSVQNFRDTFSLFTSDLYPDFSQTLTTSVSTVSFILNLLSCPFGETTCGECIYRRCDPLRGWLGVGFEGRTGCQLQCCFCRFGGAVWELLSCERWSALCLSPPNCVCLFYPELQCFTDCIMQRFPAWQTCPFDSSSDYAIICVTRKNRKSRTLCLPAIVSSSRRPLCPVWESVCLSLWVACCKQLRMQYLNCTHINSIDACGSFCPEGVEWEFHLNFQTAFPNPLKDHYVTKSTHVFS